MVPGFAGGSSEIPADTLVLPVAVAGRLLALGTAFLTGPEDGGARVRHGWAL